MLLMPSVHKLCENSTARYVEFYFSFRHSGTLALRAERQSARMSEIKHGRLGLYAAKHSM